MYHCLVWIWNVVSGSDVSQISLNEGEQTALIGSGIQEKYLKVMHAFNNLLAIRIPDRVY